MGLSALTALYVGMDFLQNVPQGGSYVQTLWTWMQIGDFNASFGLHLDGLYNHVGCSNGCWLSFLICLMCICVVKMALRRFFLI